MDQIARLSVKHHDEQSFKKMVRKQHELGGFIDDNYRMEVNFSTRKSCIDFVGVSIEDDTGQVVAFCSMEVFIGQDDLVGYMHCLGVPKEFRKNGYSVLAIKETEEAVLQKQPKVSRILTVCNEAGLSIYGKAGYIVTNKGRISQNNKRSQIRMQKVLIDKMSTGDMRYLSQSLPRGPRVSDAAINASMLTDAQGTQPQQ